MAEVLAVVNLEAVDWAEVVSGVEVLAVVVLEEVMLVVEV